MYEAINAQYLSTIKSTKVFISKSTRSASLPIQKCSEARTVVPLISANMVTY